MSVAEMRILRRMCGNTRSDKMRNFDILAEVGIASIEEKMQENCLGLVMCYVDRYIS